MKRIPFIHNRSRLIVFPLTCLSLIAATCLAQLLTTGPIQAAAATPAIQAGCATCQSTCRTRRRCVKCPKCNNDFCTLKCEDGVEKKKCFEVTQKVICIPKVKLPWHRCNPNCSKTRTIKVLAQKEYECKKCKYTWSVAEVECGEIQPAVPTQEAESIIDEVQQPDFEVTPDPTGNEVPTPPIGSRSFER